MPRCQGYGCVPGERRVHDEGTSDVGSKIKRVLSDGHIKRWTLCLSIAQLYCSSNISSINLPADSSWFFSRRPDVLRVVH